MHLNRSLCRVGSFYYRSLTSPKHWQLIESKCCTYVNEQPSRGLSSLTSTLKLSPFSLTKASPSQTQCLLPSDLRIQKRFKKTKSKGKNSNTDDDEEEEEEEEDDDNVGEENPLLVDDFEEADADGAEVTTLDIGSLRLDAFGKSGLSMTRAKIEEAFYKGDLFVNGERPTKKSCDLKEGDELDYVKGKNAEDHTMIDIRRVQLLKVPDKATEAGRMKIQVKRWRSLTVPDYTSKKDDYDT